ncbi:MAG: protease complex subunit PrcB family protein [Blastochloris sp.]|nr:protease complex subunit PrcB family protein [Blastochloris sp.]
MRYAAGRFPFIGEGPACAPRGWLALLLVTLVAGCEGVGGTKLPFTTLVQGDFLSNAEGKPLVVVSATNRERDDLAFLIDRSGTDPVIEQLSMIDYNSFFSVLVVHGAVGSGGHSIVVQELVQQDNNVTIRAILKKPASGTLNDAAFTQPYHLITVTKEGVWGKPIRFRLVVDDNQVTETIHTIP